MVTQRTPSRGVAARRGPWEAIGGVDTPTPLEAGRPACPEFHPLSGSANRPPWDFPLGAYL